MSKEVTDLLPLRYKRLDKDVAEEYVAAIQKDFQVTMKVSFGDNETDEKKKDKLLKAELGFILDNLDKKDTDFIEMLKDLGMLTGDKYQEKDINGKVTMLSDDESKDNSAAKGFYLKLMQTKENLEDKFGAPLRELIHGRAINKSQVSQQDKIKCVFRQLLNRECITSTALHLE